MEQPQPPEEEASPMSGKEGMLEIDARAMATDNATTTRSKGLAPRILLTHQADTTCKVASIE